MLKPELKLELKLYDYTNMMNKKVLPVEVYDIRKTVFIDEQKVPEELEWDEYDKESCHFIVSTILGDEIGSSIIKAIATARMIPQGADIMLGRMAVIKDYRRNKVGSFLLKACIDYARNRKVKSVIIHAQEAVLNFYQRLGFIEQGEVFYEANIRHRQMNLDLNEND